MIRRRRIAACANVFLTEKQIVSKKASAGKTWLRPSVCSVSICPVGIELVHPLPYIEAVCAAYHAVGEDRVHIPVCGG